MPVSVPPLQGGFPVSAVQNDLKSSKRLDRINRINRIKSIEWIRKNDRLNFGWKL